jgi:hypothetical protein
MASKRAVPAAPMARGLMTAEERLAFTLRLTTPRERSEAARERRYQAERDLLVAILSRIWPSHIRPAGNRGIIWTEVVCIHSPAGQLAWGLPPDRAHLFDHLERVPCKWDGHGASERAARLRKLSRQLTPIGPPTVDDVETTPAPSRSRRRSRLAGTY